MDTLYLIHKAATSNVLHAHGAYALVENQTRDAAVVFRNDLIRMAEAYDQLLTMAHPLPAAMVPR